MGPERNYVMLDRLSGPSTGRPADADEKVRSLIERMRGRPHDEFGAEPVLAGVPGGVLDPMEALGSASPAIAVPPPPVDPLAPAELQIPTAPRPVDVAGIRREEEDALTAERGPRIKPNPKGWKGFLLGLAKGAVGLAEGYGRSGQRDFMDALPSMVEGASRRIDQYRTNREDFEPFDQELKERVRERVEPLIAQYGQDRQTYQDNMDRYGIERKERDDKDARDYRDKTWEAGQANIRADDERLERELERRIQRDGRTYEYNLKNLATKVEIASASLKDARVKGVVRAQTREIDRRIDGLKATERDLMQQRRALRAQAARAASGDPNAGVIAAQIAAIDDQLDEVQAEREVLFGRYSSIAEQLAGASGPPSRGRKPMTAGEAIAVIDEAEKAGTISPEVAAQKRAAVRARAGGR